MRTDSKKITWLLILGQVFFQTAVFVVAAVSYIFNITDHGMLIGSDIGSFIANVLILGIFYLVTRKNTVQPEKNKKQSFMIVPAAFFALIIWNLIIGAVDFSLSSLSVSLFFSLNKEIKDYAAGNQYNCYRDTAFQTEVPTVDERHILIGSHLEYRRNGYSADRYADDISLYKIPNCVESCTKPDVLTVQEHQRCKYTEKEQINKRQKGNAGQIKNVEQRKKDAACYNRCLYGITSRDMRYEKASAHHLLGQSLYYESYGEKDQKGNIRGIMSKIHCSRYLADQCQYEHA